MRKQPECHVINNIENGYEMGNDYVINKREIP